MGLLRRPDKVKLIAGIISRDPALFLKVKAALLGVFGKVDFESAILNFDHTDYYEDEMGKDLKRQFFGFEKLFDLKNIYKAKLRTNLLEKRFLRSGKRMVNIDPGYLDLSKLVLFSTKDYSHRIYLNGGIFAEVTLFYKDKAFNPFPWTYPDYKTGAYMEIFVALREMYKRKKH